MPQATLPEAYHAMSDAELHDRIVARKRELGSDLVILGHHYQRDETIVHADFRGDSFKLANDASKYPDAKYIVFCGVHFMAESADILTGPHQTVILPNLSAGCSMADMANLFQVRRCWESLGSVLGPIAAPGSGEGSVRIAPVTYINSAANLKAFTGEHGGVVCTSSNATAAVSWALDRSEKLVFFPDQHLGRNTGIKLGYDPATDMALWDPFKPMGGNDPETLKRARFILWKGHCSVHQRFTVERIRKAREDHPNCQVIVHPECPMEVVAAADLSGSTEQIIRTLSAAPAGSTWAVGTEINLVNRLAHEMTDKTIFCLDPQICPCSTMYRIHPSYLLWILDGLAQGEVRNAISVPDEQKVLAKLALDRMLSLA